MFEKKNGTPLDLTFKLGNHCLFDMFYGTWNLISYIKEWLNVKHHPPMQQL